MPTTHIWKDASQKVILDPAQHAGDTGATLQAASAGAGTAINGSLTFAGLGLADAQSKLSLTPGNAGGRGCLHVHCNP